MKYHKLLIAIPFIIFSAFMGCNQPKVVENPIEEPIDALASHIDKSVKPGDDFFQYANGTWFKENPIKESERYAGLWLMIQDTVNAQVLDICKKSAEAKAEEGSNKQKIGDLYNSGMDSTKLNAEGITGLQAEFARIDAIESPSAFAKSLGELHRLGVGALFGTYIGQDDKNSSKYAVNVFQSGLSLPDREYYFEPELDSTRLEFIAFSSKMFQILGLSEAEAIEAANKNMALETSIAKASRKMEDLRDPYKNYNKIPVMALSKMMPNFDWKTYFATVGMAQNDTVIVGQPEFLRSLDQLIRQYSLDELKLYFKFQLLQAYASYLDDKTDQENFHFFKTVLNGVKVQQPRWKRVVNETNSALGELIGQVYVDEYLPKGTKEKLLEIGTAIREVYADHIKNLDWMSEATKEKALEKLATIDMKVGYPDEWKDMSSLKIGKSYVENMLAVSRWQHEYNVAKLGKPVNRKEWFMYPQTYNAYYNPSNNEIVVPGCNILVPGYEGKLADDAILYSIIGGSTFGHEITHGFDDQGCKYDANGNLTDWWTKEDYEKFSAKTKMIVAQFDTYIPVDTLHINGEMTQGENIADLGGIVMGYEAFKRTKQYKENQKIAGLSPDERFFLGYALAWMINMRPESIANQVRSDVHSPAKYRVIGPLSNMPEFYATFDVKEGDAMWRPDSMMVKIW